MLTENEIDKIAAKFESVMEKIELKKIAQFLIQRKLAVVLLNKYVLNDFKKLSAGSTIDIRYLSLIQVCREIEHNNVPGAIAELGVFRGTFAKRIRLLLDGRDFYLFDTFQGFDKQQFENDNNTYSLGKPALDPSRFNNTSIELVLKEVGGDPNIIHPCAGLFPHTAKIVEEKKFCFVSLDADLYQPMRDGLEFFYPRLSPGGYIMVHDFRLSSYPGTQDAVYDFVKRNQVPYVPIPDCQGSVIIAKPLEP